MHLNLAKKVEGRLDLPGTPGSYIPAVTVTARWNFTYPRVKAEVFEFLDLREYIPYTNRVLLT